jgi:hypothetical protein
MGPSSSNSSSYCSERARRFSVCVKGNALRVSGAALLSVFATVLCAAQDVKLNVTYICSGERIYVESCNIRDLSDAATCQVAHPDRPKHNGFMAYTSETRGSLKKLFPTCKQPTPQEIAAADAFQKKQQAIYDANVQKANGQLNAAATGGRAPVGGAGSPQQQITPPKNAEERAMRRCVSSGRLPATCTGNSLLGAFGQMLGQVLPSAAKEPATGPVMAGVFQGAGSWRLDFIDGGVLVNCSSLSPNQESYSLAFRPTGTVLTIDTKPKPLVLSFRADGTIVGPPGPVTIDGVVATGTARSGPDPNASSGYTDKNGISLTNQQAASSSEIYQGAMRHYGSVDVGTSYTTFSPRRATCPAISLSSKGASVGVQTMQTDLLKSLFNDGDKGPPTPTGIRMQGIFAAATGFSAQFFPESVVLGCGPDSARAYPYTVVADGTKPAIHVNAPDHPLTIAFRPDGSLDAGSEPYLVHGRIVTGQNDDGDFTFAPMEQTCNLAVLTPSKEIPSSGGTAATMTAAAAAPGTKGGGLSTPAAPLGNAALSIVSGLPAQPGTPNPLAGRPYVLLRDSYGDALAKGGIAVPAGVSPYKYVGTVCGPGKTPECQKILSVIDANAASAVRADANGRGVLPGVPPGTYYLMISTRFGNQALVWEQAVQLKAGVNSVTLDQSNATPMN